MSTLTYGPTPYHRLKRQQLLTLAIALEAQRDHCIERLNAVHAVAVRRDPDGGPPYPVCRHHTHLRRGDLVPLSILLGGNDGSTTSGSVSPALPETGE